jgi:hypothetical protein
MVIGRLTGYLALGLVGAFLLNALIRPQAALGTGAALQETGSGIASIGAGIGESLRSIGSGSAKLFDPLFTLRDLVFSSSVPGGANVSPTAQVEGRMISSAIYPKPVSKSSDTSTITWSNSSATVPTLSAAAKAFYRARGVSVT